MQKISYIYRIGLLFPAMVWLQGCVQNHTGKKGVPAPWSVQSSFNDDSSGTEVQLVFEQYFRNDTLVYGCEHKTKVLTTNFSTVTAGSVSMSPADFACPLYLNGRLLQIAPSSAYRIIEVSKSENDSIRLVYTNKDKVRF